MDSEARPHAGRNGICHSLLGACPFGNRCEVQRLLIQNKRALTRKWAKVEYLLTGNHTRSRVSHTMVGKCGTRKSTTKSFYYNGAEHRNLLHSALPT